MCVVGGSLLIPEECGESDKGGSGKFDLIFQVDRLFQTDESHDRSAYERMGGAVVYLYKKEMPWRCCQMPAEVGSGR